MQPLIDVCCRAQKFDRNPALKALIVRHYGLPEPLDSLVAANLLGSSRQTFYWPESSAQPTVLRALREAFRSPSAQASQGKDAGFQALRYFSSLLFVARKHGMLATEFAPLGVQQTSVERIRPKQLPLHLRPQRIFKPERGALLISHPCQPDWFSRTIVLLCDYSPDDQGAYGVVINKPLEGKNGGKVIDFLHKQRGKAAVGFRAMGGSFAASGIEGNKRFSPEAAATKRKDGENADVASSATVAAKQKESAQQETGTPARSYSSHLSAEESFFLDAVRKAFMLKQGALLSLHHDQNLEAVPGTSSMQQEEDSDDDEDMESLTKSSFVISLEDAMNSLSEEEIAAAAQIGLEAAASMDPEQQEAIAAAFEAAVASHGPEEMRELQKLQQKLHELIQSGQLVPLNMGDQNQQHDVGEDSHSNMFVEDNEEHTSHLVELLRTSTGGEATQHNNCQGLDSADDSLAQNPFDTSLLATGAGLDMLPGGSFEGLSSGDGVVCSKVDPSGDNVGSRRTGPVEPTTPGAHPRQLMALLPHSQVLLGGPVPGVTLLHALPALGGEQVLEPSGTGATRMGVFIGSDVTMSQAAAVLGGQQHLPNGRKVSEAVNVVLGDSRWSPGQLEAEVESGAWAIVRCSAAGELLDLFGPKSRPRAGQPSGEVQGAMWRRLMESLGDAYADMALVPRGVWEDLQLLEI
jgi:putative AlgH/UPF0301 family transcriptional regulator